MLRHLRRFVALSLLVAIACVTSISARAQTISDLEQGLKKYAHDSGGEMGVTAIHIETGRRVSLNNSERFPMASAYKVPIAVQLLLLVDEGKENLDRLIKLEPKDIHPEGGPLTDWFSRGRQSISIRELLEEMITVSDNSAADVILRLAGGPQVATAHLHSVGIEAMTIDRSTIQLIYDMYGVPLPPEGDWGPGKYMQTLTSLRPDKQIAAAEQFARDPRDTTTPDAMAALLIRLYRKDLLRPETSGMLLDMMRRCQTGEARLKGLLPVGTDVAHKTGTAVGVNNDVGIISLPNGLGHVAIVVFIKGSKAPVLTREHSIAEVARLVYDFFVNNKN